MGHVPVRSVGDGPAVLAVHRLPADGRLWDGVARQLAPQARLVLLGNDTGGALGRAGGRRALSRGTRCRIVP